MHCSLTCLIWVISSICKHSPSTRTAAVSQVGVRACISAEGGAQTLCQPTTVVQGPSYRGFASWSSFTFLQDARQVALHACFALLDLGLSFASKEH